MIEEEEAAVIRRSLKLTFEDMDVIPHAVGTIPDHVHVVVSAPPKVSPASLVKRMKGAATHAVKERVDRSEARSVGKANMVCCRLANRRSLLSWRMSRTNQHAMPRASSGLAWNGWPLMRSGVNEKRRLDSYRSDG